MKFSLSTLVALAFVTVGVLGQSCNDRNDCPGSDVCCGGEHPIHACTLALAAVC
ncbi:hypothetical protein EXIGLDRAFT_735665 [Exidia glandulosa HHB12029]|uniref:Hydrophobin n=1 Tax=Exidia glandulosa HHB12029 TaxID=1314781 RepID=A0A165PHC0_EXIGL|nr:hypothetical protein EXIGLDRAFT_735665 [Exidia glandulosa HHB12029]